MPANYSSAACRQVAALGGSRGLFQQCLLDVEANVMLSPHRLYDIEMLSQMGGNGVVCSRQREAHPIDRWQKHLYLVLGRHSLDGMLGTE